MFGKYLRDSSDVLYLIFRLLIGLLFIQHGVTKVFGWLNPNSIAPAFSATWIFGFFEVLVGICIALGLLTRLAAVGGALQMLIAYFKAHAPAGAIPLLNHGELALVYFAAFLVLMAYGGKKWQLDQIIFGKELI